MSPFDRPKSQNPFLASQSQSPWWLRESTDEELETHKRLTDELTRLTNDHEQTR